jgi:hypothetical protein
MSPEDVADALLHPRRSTQISRWCTLCRRPEMLPRTRPAFCGGQPPTRFGGRPDQWCGPAVRAVLAPGLLLSTVVGCWPRSVQTCMLVALRCVSCIWCWSIPKALLLRRLFLLDPPLARLRWWSLAPSSTPLRATLCLGLLPAVW